VVRAVPPRPDVRGRTCEAGRARQDVRGRTCEAGRARQTLRSGDCEAEVRERGCVCSGPRQAIRRQAPPPADACTVMRARCCGTRAARPRAARPRAARPRAARPRAARPRAARPRAARPELRSRVVRDPCCQVACDSSPARRLVRAGVVAPRLEPRSPRSGRVDRQFPQFIWATLAMIVTTCYYGTHVRYTRSDSTHGTRAWDHDIAARTRVRM